MTKKTLFNIVLVHTSREWERVRLTRPFQDMPYDNIESVDEIVSIANEIMGTKVLTGFLRATDKDDYFMRHTGDLSDTYIERLAHNLIKELIN